MLGNNNNLNNLVKGQIILNNAKNDTDPCAYICKDKYQWQAINAEQLLKIIKAQKDSSIVKARKFINEKNVETYYIQLGQRYFTITKDQTEKCTYKLSQGNLQDNSINKIITNTKRYENRNIEEELLPSYYHLNGKIYIDLSKDNKGKEFKEVTPKDLTEIAKKIESKSKIQVDNNTYFKLTCTNLSDPNNTKNIIDKYYKVDEKEDCQSIKDEDYKNIEEIFKYAIKYNATRIIETTKLQILGDDYVKNEQNDSKYTMFGVDEKTGAYKKYTDEDYKAFFASLPQEKIEQTNTHQYFSIKQPPRCVYIVHNVIEGKYEVTDTEPQGEKLKPITNQELKALIPEHTVEIMSNDKDAGLYLLNPSNGQVIIRTDEKQKIVKNIINKIQEKHKTNYIMHDGKCYFFDTQDTDIIILDQTNGTLKRLNKKVKNNQVQEQYEALKDIKKKREDNPNNQNINVELKIYEQALCIPSEIKSKEKKEDKQCIISIDKNNNIGIVTDLKTDKDYQKINYNNHYFINTGKKWYLQKQEGSEQLIPANDYDSTMCNTILEQTGNIQDPEIQQPKIFLSDKTLQLYVLKSNENNKLTTVMKLSQENIEKQFNFSVEYNNEHYIKDPNDQNNKTWYKFEDEDLKKNIIKEGEVINEINNNRIINNNIEEDMNLQQKTKSIFKEDADNPQKITSVTDNETLSILSQIDTSKDTQCIIQDVTKKQKKLFIVQRNNENNNEIDFNNNNGETYKVEQLTHDIIQQQYNNGKEEKIPYTICDVDTKHNFSIIYYDRTYYTINQKGILQKYNNEDKIEVFNQLINGRCKLMPYGEKVYIFSNNRIKSDNISDKLLAKLAKEGDNLYIIKIDGQTIYAYVMESDIYILNDPNNKHWQYYHLVASLVNDLHKSKDKTQRVIPCPVNEIPRLVRYNEEEHLEKGTKLMGYDGKERIEAYEYAIYKNTTNIKNIKDTKYYLFDINPQTRTVSTLSSTISNSTLDKPKDDKYNSKEQTLQIVRIDDKMVLLRKDKTKEPGNSSSTKTQTTAFATKKAINGNKNDKKNDTMFECTDYYDQLLNSKTSFKIVDKDKKIHKLHLCCHQDKLYEFKDAKQSSDNYKMDEYTQAEAKSLFPQLENAVDYNDNNILLIEKSIDDNKEPVKEFFINIKDNWFKVTKESITKDTKAELEDIEVCQKMKDGKNKKQSNKYIINKTGTNRFSVSSFKNHIAKEGKVYLTATYVEEQEKQDGGGKEQVKHETLKIYQDNTGQWFVKQQDEVISTTFSQLITKMKNAIELFDKDGKPHKYVPFFDYMVEIKTVNKGFKDNILGRTIMSKNTILHVKKQQQMPKRKKNNSVAEDKSKPFSKIKEATVVKTKDFWDALVSTVDNEENKDCDYKIIKYKNKEGKQITKNIAYLKGNWYEIDIKNNTIKDITKVIKQSSPDDNNEEHNIMRQLLNAKNTYNITPDQTDYYITEIDVHWSTALPAVKTYLDGLADNKFNDQQKLAYKALVEALKPHLAKDKKANKTELLKALEDFVKAFKKYCLYLQDLIDAMSDNTKPLKKRTAFTLSEDKHTFKEDPEAENAIELQNNIKITMTKLATHEENDNTFVKVYAITLPEENGDKQEKDTNKMKYKRVFAIHSLEFPDQQWEKYKDQYGLDKDILYVYGKDEKGFYPILSENAVKTLNEIKENKIKYNPKCTEHMSDQEKALFGEEGNIEICSYPRYNRRRNPEHLRFYKRIRLAENEDEYILVDCEPQEIETIKNCLTSNKLAYLDSDGGYKEIYTNKSIKTELKENKAKGIRYNQEMRKVNNNRKSLYGQKFLNNTNNKKKKNSTNYVEKNKKYIQEIQNNRNASKASLNNYYNKNSKKTTNNTKINSKQANNKNKNNNADINLE